MAWDRLRVPRERLPNEATGSQFWSRANGRVAERFKALDSKSSGVNASKQVAPVGSNPTPSVYRANPCQLGMEEFKEIY